ncbi:F-box/WD repeat-containing protein 2, partial [Xenoophorus captivus]
LVTGSFDNTIACWEWSTGAKIQQFRGHTGAGQYKYFVNVHLDISLLFYFLRSVIKMEDPANLSLLSFGEVFALLFDNCFLYVMDLRTESISGRWPLPAYRKSKRGSSFLAGVTSWLNGLDGGNDSGLVFATSMPDHSIHLVLWKENG